MKISTLAIGVALWGALLTSAVWAEEQYRSVLIDPAAEELDSYRLVSAAADAPGSAVGGPSLAEEVADLKAWKAQTLAKEAAVRRKASGKPTVKIGGCVQWDWANFSQDPGSVAQIGDVQNGSEPRRAWLFMKGDAFQVVDYVFRFGIEGQDAGSEITFREMFITVKELPIAGHVRLGHFKEPFSLDQLTSSKFTMFMERNLADVFAPSRNVGIMAFNQSENKRMTWAIGAFKDQIGLSPPEYKDDHGATAVTGRVTFAPWYDEATDGRGVLHTGVAYSYRDATNDAVQFRQRPEAHLSDYVVDTTALLADNYQLFNAEVAYVYGPFSVQSEYTAAVVDHGGGASSEFDGMYIQASYFLTGEHRPYGRSDGTFGRVKPFENFFCVRDGDGDVQMGKGAWEVAYRYSCLDLNDGPIVGGRVSDHTVGLSWYLNPYTKVMWNYVRSDVNRPPAGGGAAIDGAMDTLEMRAQIDF